MRSLATPETTMAGDGIESRAVKVLVAHKSFYSIVLKGNWTNTMVQSN